MPGKSPVDRQSCCHHLWTVYKLSLVSLVSQKTWLNTDCFKLGLSFNFFMYVCTVSVNLSLLWWVLSSKTVVPELNK